MLNAVENSRFPPEPAGMGNKGVTFIAPIHKYLKRSGSS
jgi:hypothetical protein